MMRRWCAQPALLAVLPAHVIRWARRSIPRKEEGAALPQGFLIYEKEITWTCSSIFSCLEGTTFAEQRVFQDQISERNGHHQRIAALRLYLKGGDM